MKLLTVIALLAGIATAGAENKTVANPFAELEARTQTRIGVAAIDVSTKREVMHRADERFALCSTFKFLAAAAVLQRVDENKEQLDRFVPYGEAQLLEYAPVTRAHVQEGGMKLEALCAAAIEVSDNTAGNLLLDAIGGPKGLTEFARKLGDRSTRLDRTEPTLNLVSADDERDTTTPADMCRDLQRLFASDVLSPASRTRLEDWMKGTKTSPRMIRASVPAGWTVGDKTGRSGHGATNDIAILRPPSGGPIFIAIYLFDGRDSAEAQDALVAEVTKIALAQLSVARETAADFHPIIEVQSGYLLGASADGKWMKGEAAAKRYRPGISLELFDLTSAKGTIAGGVVEPNQDVCPEIMVVSLGETAAEAKIAVAANWQALPRPVRVADTTQPVYQSAVRDFLQTRGLKNPVVKIAQILRVDLDGDGEEEVLISATHYATAEDDGAPNESKAGDYSFVLLRQVRGGKVETKLVGGEFYPKAKNFNAPSVYRVAAVLDLNGDGKMEVVVTSNYYEGGTTTVYDCGAGKVKTVLEVSCGV